MHAFKSFLSLWGAISVVFLLSTAALSSSFFTQPTGFTFATLSVTGPSISLPPCVPENNTLSGLGCVPATSDLHHSHPPHPHHSKPDHQPDHHSKPAHQTGVNPLPWPTVPLEVPSTVPCSGNSAATCWLIKGTTYKLDTFPTLGKAYTVGPTLPNESDVFTADNVPSKTAAQITPLPSAAVSPIRCAADPAMLCVSQNGQIHTVGTIRPRQIQDGVAEPTLSISVSGNTVPYPPSLSPGPCSFNSTLVCLPFGTSEEVVGALGGTAGSSAVTTTTPQNSLATSSGFQNTASTASQTSLSASSGFQNTPSPTATTSQTSLSASSSFQNTETSTSQTPSVPLTTVTVVNATVTPSSLASSSSSAPTTTSKKSGSFRSIKTSMMLMLTCCIISLSANCLSIGCSPIAPQKTASAPSQKSISSKMFRLPLMLLFFSSVISLARGQSITTAPSQPLVYGNISIFTCTGASPECIVVDGTTIELSASLTVTYITPTDTQPASIPCVNGITPPGCYIPDISTEPTWSTITPTGSSKSIGLPVMTSTTLSALPSVSGPPLPCSANSMEMCIVIGGSTITVQTGSGTSEPASSSSQAETSTTGSTPASSSSTSNRTSTSPSRATQTSQAMSLRKFQSPFLLLVGVIVASAFVSLFGSDEEPSKDKETDSAVEKKTQQV